MEPKKLSLTDILLKTPALKPLLVKAQELSAIQRLVTQNLQSPLNTYCKVASYQKGILTLSLTSAVWAHQLRFAKTTLLSSLRTTPAFCGLKAIELSIRPLEVSPFDQPLATFPAPILSKQNAEGLRTTAAAVSSEALQAALLRLAKHSIGANSS